ncbi:snare domain-containing protein [Cystoisospora suis]|uniref:Snare domain-containing protein n=1 Tax=Cystoisospora suis TaxID=483139 RepID=A0A2C6L6M5_9APIC|nr:snare domain-containing protein [Cystoisospora suis]
MEEVAEHDSLLQRTVADERHKGLQRIHGQVKQANQIFKDLAQLVLQQGSSIESIESQMQSAHSQIKGAASELYKAHQVQRRSRQRRCLVLFLVFAVISFLFYFYSSVSTVHQRAEDTPQVALSLNPPSSSEPGEKSSQDGSSAESSSLEGRSSPNASSPTDQQDSLGSRFSVGSAIGRVIEAAPMSAGGPRVVLPGGVGVLSRTFKPHPPN